MKSDAEVIAERRRADERAFLIKATNPAVAPGLAPAANALRELLADRRWHAHPATLAGMLRGSTVTVKTADNLMRRARQAGLIERRGEYVRAAGRTPPKDTREWRLIEWPTSVDI